MKYQYQPTKINTLTALHDTIIVSDMSFDARITSSGIILPGDDTKLSGVLGNISLLLTVAGLEVLKSKIMRVKKLYVKLILMMCLW